MTYEEEKMQADMKDLEAEIMTKYPRMDPLVANTLAYYAVYDPDYFEEITQKWHKGELSGGKKPEGGAIEIIPAEKNKDDDKLDNSISVSEFREKIDGVSSSAV